MRVFINLVLLTFLLGSCSSSLKKIQYLNNDKLKPNYYTGANDYKLKVGDNIYVQIIGSNPMVVSNSNVGPGYMLSEETINLFSHTIDKEGKITLPLIGEMYVTDKTVDEATRMIKSRAIEYYRAPTIIMKMVNKTITVLGEVSRPGKYNIFKDKINIFEALGLAGDLSDYGNRKRIVLVREIDGEEKIVNIDITSSDIINSKYYTLFPNDVLYVPPRNRIYGTKTLSFTGILGTTMSVISTILSVVILIK